MAEALVSILLEQLASVTVQEAKQVYGARGGSTGLYTRNWKAKANGYQMLLQLMFSIKKINLSFSKEDNVQCGLQQNSKSCSQEHRSGNLAFIDSTPKWKVLESVIHRGKRPLRML
nr:hypothetical protein CFP56_61909 [Quercus suber]